MNSGIFPVVGDAEKSNKDQEIEKLVQDRLQAIEQRDYYALLGVEPRSNTDEITNAYFRLAKRLHPDALADVRDPALRAQATQVFKALTEAFKVLSDHKKRASYDAQRQAETSPELQKAPRERDTTEEARIFHHKGRKALERKDFRLAQESFERAVGLDPSNPHYACMAGYAILLDPDFPTVARLEKAKEWFDRALQAGQSDCEPYYFMSLYYKQKGDVHSQRRYLQDALTLNPRHVESNRELRLLDMRTRRQQTLLGRIVQSVRKILGQKG